MVIPRESSVNFTGPGIIFKAAPDQILNIIRLMHLNGWFWKNLTSGSASLCSHYLRPHPQLELGFQKFNTDIIFIIFLTITANHGKDLKLQLTTCSCFVTQLIAEESQVRLELQMALDSKDSDIEQLRCQLTSLSIHSLDSTSISSGNDLDMGDGYPGRGERIPLILIL